LKEEEFKAAIKNFLMMQNNNERNFEILQRQIDKLQDQLDQMKEFRNLFKIPKESNKDREPFEFYDEISGIKKSED
tara:strand:+ start:170 stop:397 length:228 start_codon:yes stop_codon:yes gene_type:complete